MAHVVWDWNGTLFDDLEVIVESVNASLAELGAGPIDAEGYRDHYARPVRRFYEQLLERPVGEAELDRANAAFYAAYVERLSRASLATGARAALDWLATGGTTQSVLSLARQHELIPLVESLDVARYMAFVQGTTGPVGGSKVGLVERHLDHLAVALGGFEADGAVVIGDSLDDVAAARSAGVAAVLFDGGSHHRAELEQVGVPVASSLLEAAMIARDGGAAPPR